MSYTLGHIDLSTYGFMPGKATDSNVALSGCWDLPKRMGKTHHDWSENHGLEPYVDTSEIRFSGRDLLLSGVILGSSEADTLSKSYALVGQINFFDSVVTLATDWGDFDVFVNNEITITYLPHNIAKIEIPLRQPVVDLTGGDALSAYSKAFLGELTQIRKPDGIDGHLFENLGVTPLKIEGYTTRPEPKSMHFHAYENEGYQITPSKELEIKFTCLVIGDDYADWHQKVKTLYGLISGAGMRHLTQYSAETTNHHPLIEFFCKDGWKISHMMVNSNRVSGKLELPMTLMSINHVRRDYNGWMMTDYDGFLLYDF